MPVPDRSRDRSNSDLSKRDPFGRRGAHLCCDVRRQAEEISEKLPWELEDGVVQQ